MDAAAELLPDTSRSAFLLDDGSSRASSPTPRVPVGLMSDGLLHVVLFYKYSPVPEPMVLAERLRTLCSSLSLSGRVLVAAEGINGTLSASTGAALDDFSKELVSRAGGSFSDIDWKRSTSSIEPFPDLVVKVVRQLVNYGPTTASVTEGGVHLTPQEFHEMLSRDVVLVDVRNTFEYQVGHFEGAVEPGMKSTSEFPAFCSRIAPICKEKPVLMYCTGGIRCEKASAMLRQEGVTDVYQLEGGIHRYLEAFPEGGKFKGKNFVFDKRVSLGPEDADVVGCCVECGGPFDEIRGNRLCTVCRLLVLVCPSCQQRLPEYHCESHRHLRNCYFTFLERFGVTELTGQAAALRDLIATMDDKKRRVREGVAFSRNKRRTLAKQLAKVEARIAILRSDEAEDGTTAVIPGDTFPCRTCFREGCDGLCWGFWKTAGDDWNEAPPGPVGR